MVSGFLLAGLAGFVSCKLDDDSPPDIVINRPFEVALGFDYALVTAELSLPTSLAFAPDGSGRLFINELQTGNIRIYKNGELLATPFATVPTNVTVGLPDGEAGLIGLAFDPNFTLNGYVYVSYAESTPGGILGSVARFTASGDRGTDFTVLLDSIPGGINRQVRGLRFGPGGFLYVATGDADAVSNVQDDNSLVGKILRMNPDGSIPADNPVPGSYTWAKGFRNPNDMVFTSDGDLITTDEGLDSFDEVNVVVENGNYAWPNSWGITFDQDYVDPILVWQGQVQPGGMTIYTGDDFPSQYQGRLVTVLRGPLGNPNSPNGSKSILTGTVTGTGVDANVVFEVLLNYDFEGFANPYDVAQGPDGQLYFTDILLGGIYRIFNSNP